MDPPAADISPSKLQSIEALGTEFAKAEYSGSSSNIITFKHPGYSDQFNQNVLLRLYAFDRDGGGLHYATALAACSIVAGNAQDGYFTHERDGERVVLKSDELLRKKRYYFYIPSALSPRYPIYRSFEHWAFPHSNLPPEWAALTPPTTSESAAPPSASNLSYAILRRDVSCRVSKAMDYIESAHLCPRSQAEWFEANGMGQYNQNTNLSGDFVVDDISNAIALRSDIHRAFDDGKFVIVPKEGKWLVHFLGQTNTLGRDFHNTAIELDQGISVAFLFARFAWSIFPGIQQFLEAGLPREVLMRVTEEGEYKEVTKTCSGEELRAFPARRRSVSPKKRKALGGDESQLYSAVISTKRKATGDDIVPCDEARAKRRRVSDDPCDWDVKDVLRDVTPETYLASSLPALDDWEASTAGPPEPAPKLSTSFETPQPSPPSDSPDSPRLTAAEKQAWIRSRRPSNWDLYCCHYDSAEAAAKAGLPGKPELGGRYLCFECLGVEYVDADPDVL